MIVGTGIDLLETSRMERELARGAWHEFEGVFTVAEIANCSRDRLPWRRFAACYVAKEATLKALGVDVEDLALFREAEVTLGSDSDCAVVLRGRLAARFQTLRARKIRVAIATSSKLTGALALVEA